MPRPNTTTSLTGWQVSEEAARRLAMYCHALRAVLLPKRTCGVSHRAACQQGEQLKPNPPNPKRLSDPKMRTLAGGVVVLARLPEGFAALLQRGGHYLAHSRGRHQHPQLQMAHIPDYHLTSRKCP